MRIYKNPLADAILSNIKDGGLGKLHVVTDFDGTLTQEYDKDGIKQPTVFALLRQPGVLSDDYKKKHMNYLIFITHSKLILI